MKKRLNPFAALLMGVLLMTPWALFGQYGDFYDVPSSIRIQYLIRTYGVTSEQASRYVSALQRKFEKECLVQEKSIPWDSYKQESRKVFIDFRKDVVAIFGKTKYTEWRANTLNNEWGRFLGEDLQISPQNVAALINAKTLHDETRNKILATPTEGNLDLIKENRMRFENEIRVLLGSDRGERHIDLLEINRITPINMDKYKIPYNKARTVTEIEVEYSRRDKALRTIAYASTDDRREAISRNQDQMEQVIARTLTSDVVSKRKAMSDKEFDYLLSRYGLNKEQIASFKSIYNNHAISIYKVTQGVLSQEKMNRRSVLNQDFCKAVKPLFNDEKAYRKWLGLWMMEFERDQKDKAKKVR